MDILEISAEWMKAATRVDVNREKTLNLKSILCMSNMYFYENGLYIAQSLGSKLSFFYFFGKKLILLSKDALN